MTPSPPAILVRCDQERSVDQDLRHDLILQAVRRIVEDGKVFHVLADTPEQLSDVLRVLVDDRMVVGFELARGEPKAEPTDVATYSVEEYRRAVTGLAARELTIAIEMARDELARS